jgi:acetoin:2,6-dichlorophenolindophenol oxidoreductase subunit alpha
MNDYSGEVLVTLDHARKIEMLRRMLRIRMFEQAATEHAAGGRIAGALHTSVGQEASIVGSCMALRDDDYMVGTHRSHGHPIGKGAGLRGLFAELLGKASGVNSGKGGSMHLSDFSVGSLGETSIVGSGLPVATGAGLGIKMQGGSRVSLCFFGDGAANEGTFHESLNLASVWQLPVVYVCENNQYGELTAHVDACAVRRISDRAAGYTMPGETVDGMDVGAVYAAVKSAVDRARSGGGPSLVETDTYRFFGHSGGPDRTELYRTHAEVARWRDRDPITLLRDRLVRAGMTEAELDAIEASEQELVDQAWHFALDSPLPDPQEAYLHVFADPIPLT